jgi:hypothetical protein
MSGKSSFIFPRARLWVSILIFLLLLAMGGKAIGNGLTSARYSEMFYDRSELCSHAERKIYISREAREVFIWAKRLATVRSQEAI